MDSFAFCVFQEKQEKEKETAPISKWGLNRNQACESRKKVQVHQNPVKQILIREKLLRPVLNSL